MCSHCGATLAEGAGFCGACGTPTAATLAADEEPTGVHNVEEKNRETLKFAVGLLREAREEARREREAAAAAERDRDERQRLFIAEQQKIAQAQTRQTYGIVLAVVLILGGVVGTYLSIPGIMSSSDGSDDAPQAEDAP